jgi:hypothetical protein
MAFYKVVIFCVVKTKDKSGMTKQGLGEKQKNVEKNVSY